MARTPRQTLTLRDRGPGRALYARADGPLYASRGYAVHVSVDGGETWRLRARLPTRWLRTPGRFSRLAARLLRFEVRALAALSDGTVVAANRDGVFRAGPEEVRMRPARLEDGGRRPSPPFSITVGPGDAVLFGEYDPRTAHGQPVRIFVSRDGGRRFEVAHTIEPGSVMHVHSLLFDPKLDLYWVFAGDYGDEAGIGHLSADLQHFEWFRKGEQRYRLCEAFDLGERLVYATDSNVEENAILSLDKRSGATETLARLEGSSLYACRFGSLLCLSTTVEPSRVTTSDRAALWVSRDGDSWARVLEVEKDRWPPILQFGGLVLPRGASRSETIWMSGQAVKGLDGRLVSGELVPDGPGAHRG